MAMTKRIRKKKTRMQLIKALEKMESFDGIVLVDGQVVRLSHCIVSINPSDNAKIYVDVSAHLEDVIKIRNRKEVWARG